MNIEYQNGMAPNKNVLLFLMPYFWGTHLTATDCHHQTNQQNFEKLAANSETKEAPSWSVILTVKWVVLQSGSISFVTKCDIPRSLQTALRNFRSLIVWRPRSTHALCERCSCRGGKQRRSI